jgi:hypothetical protein
MEVRLEGLNEPLIDATLVARAAAEIAGRAPVPDDVTLILTDDYAGTVNRLRPDPVETYVAERGSILAAAITLHESGTSCTVVANGLFWLRQEEIDRVMGELRRQGVPEQELPEAPIAEVMDVVRVVAHEAEHVRLHQRGEGRFVRDEMGSRDYFSCISAIASEEFRIERQLWEESWPSPTSYMEAVADDIGAIDDVLGGVVRHPWNEESNQRVLAVISQDIPNAFLQLGYAIPEGAAKEAQAGRAVSSPGWRRVIGPCWEDLREAFHRFPLSSDELSHAEFDESHGRLARAIDKCLRAYGLTIIDQGDRRIRYELRTEAFD